MLDLLYAIKHTPTGAVMPQRAGAGHSYWEPTENNEGKHPRLFFTLKSAQNALTAWLSGEWKREVGTNIDWEGNSEGYDELMVDTPAIPRVRSDMAILVFKVAEHA